MSFFPTTEVNIASEATGQPSVDLKGILLSRFSTIQFESQAAYAQQIQFVLSRIDLDQLPIDTQNAWHLGEVCPIKGYHREVVFADEESGLSLIAFVFRTSTSTPVFPETGSNILSTPIHDHKALTPEHSELNRMLSVSVCRQLDNLQVREEFFSPSPAINDRAVAHVLFRDRSEGDFTTDPGDSKLIHRFVIMKKSQPNLDSNKEGRALFLHVYSTRKAEGPNRITDYLEYVEEGSDRFHLLAHRKATGDSGSPARTVPTGSYSLLASLVFPSS